MTKFEITSSEIPEELLPANLLVVDDQTPVCRLLKKYFEQQGVSVYSAKSGNEALEFLDKLELSTVLTDINMPDINGLELLEKIKSKNKDIPVIMMTASQEIQSAKSAFKLGAYDYITKPFDQAEVLISVTRALEHRKLIQENREYQKNLESTVSIKTRELQSTLVRLEKAFKENREAHLETIFVLSNIAETNDRDTGNHIKRVSRYCEEVSKRMNLGPEFIDQIAYSSPMHDIGKIFINPSILKKQGKLTPQEYEKAKEHTIRGAEVLKGVPFLKMAHNIALYHHENYDGSGYPKGLAGDEIPIEAQIVAICDVFDALVSKRCYKEEYSLQTSISIIKSEVGRKFSPKLAEILFAIQDDLYQIYCELKDK